MISSFYLSLKNILFKSISSQSFVLQSQETDSKVPLWPFFFFLGSFYLTFPSGHFYWTENKNQSTTPPFFDIFQLSAI